MSRGWRAHELYPLGNPGYDAVFEELWAHPVAGSPDDNGNDGDLLAWVQERYGEAKGKPLSEATLDYWLEEFYWPLVRLQRQFLKSVEVNVAKSLIQQVLWSLLEEKMPETLGSLGGIITYRGKDKLRNWQRLRDRDGKAALGKASATSGQPVVWDWS